MKIPTRLMGCLLILALLAGCTSSGAGEAQGTPEPATPTPTPAPVTSPPVSPTPAATAEPTTVPDLVDPAAPEPEPEPSPLLDGLEEALLPVIDAQGGHWSVSVIAPDDGALALGGGRQEAASLIKLFIAGAVYRDVQAGTLSADAVEGNLADMICRSDNSAANRLVSLLGGGSPDAGMERVNDFARDIGCTDTVMARGLGDWALATGERENYTSAADCAKLLGLILDGRLCGSPEISDAFMDLLLAQERRDKIPQGLPDGVAAGNKTGELPAAEHDGAVVFAEGGTYILVVMATELTDTASARGTIGEISRLVYRHLNP